MLPFISTSKQILSQNKKEFFYEKLLSEYVEMKWYTKFIQLRLISDQIFINLPQKRIVILKLNNMGHLN
jgi:hypothetical protein